MGESILSFLLVYNGATGQLERLDEFGSDSEAALTAYAEAEKAFEGSDFMQIVLIGSDSLDTVRITHANYFEPTGEPSDYFAGL